MCGADRPCRTASTGCFVTRACRSGWLANTAIGAGSRIATGPGAGSLSACQACAPPSYNRDGRAAFAPDLNAGVIAKASGPCALGECDIGWCRISGAGPRLGRNPIGASSPLRSATDDRPFARPEPSPRTCAPASPGRFLSLAGMPCGMFFVTAEGKTRPLRRDRGSPRRASRSDEADQAAVAQG